MIVANLVIALLIVDVSSIGAKSNVSPKDASNNLDALSSLLHPLLPNFPLAEQRGTESNLELIQISYVIHKMHL